VQDTEKLTGTFKVISDSNRRLEWKMTTKTLQIAKMSGNSGVSTSMWNVEETSRREDSQQQSQ
jgi:hypothetical protein